MQPSQTPSRKALIRRFLMNHGSAKWLLFLGELFFLALLSGVNLFAKTLDGLVLIGVVVLAGSAITCAWASGAAFRMERGSPLINTPPMVVLILVFTLHAIFRMLQLPS